MDNERFVVRQAQASLPSQFGSFQAIGFRNALDGSEHVALVKGSIGSMKEPVLVRMHSECLTGDAFGSLRCDCRAQLEAAMHQIEMEGEGVLVYLRQEGRGIGLINKLKAYSLQDGGLDTVEANEKLGFAPDLRNYGVGAQILSDLGIHRLRLLTNNPRKIAGLGGYGLEVVDRVPLEIDPGDYNAQYLATKREKLGHLFEEQPERSHWVIGLDSHTNDETILSKLVQRMEHLAEEHKLQLQAEHNPRLLALWERPRFVWSIQNSDPTESVMQKLLAAMASWQEISRIGVLHAVKTIQISHPPQWLNREERSLESLRTTKEKAGWLQKANQPALIHWS